MSQRGVARNVTASERYCERYISGCKLDLASEKVWPSQELQLSY